MSIEIHQTDDIEACRDLRRKVFIREQGVSEEEEVDDLDPVAIHILAKVDGIPKATARILIKGDTAKIGRVCVLVNLRGTGLGAALMRKTIEVCKAQEGVEKSVLGAQTHAIPFYEKLGFRAYGPIFLDADVEHRDMELDL
jgi:ElaA protein